MILTSADCAERRTAVLRLSPKASAAIGLMDKRMELLVISLFSGEVVGLDTSWISGPPVGGAFVSASVRVDGVLDVASTF